MSRGNVPKEEIERRVNLTVMLLERGMKKHEIKKELKAFFGISARSCERYLARARLKLEEQMGYDRNELLNCQLTRLYEIQNSDNSTQREKILAAQEIRKLLLISTNPEANRNREVRDRARAMRANLKRRSNNRHKH